MSAHPVLQLGDIADVFAGDPAPQDPQAFAPNGPLFVRMQDVGRHHRHPALQDSTDRLSPEWVARNRLRLFPKDSILIPKSGASVNLNHRAKLATDAYVVSHLAIVIPDRTRIDPDYLYWWSANYDPRAQAQVTSLPSLKLSTLKSAVVPLPPLNEQRRIVGILNRVAKIERLRKQAQERLREFIPALFNKMFGELATNPMGWPVCALHDLCEVDRQGFGPNSPIALRFPFVGVENVESYTGAIILNDDSRTGNQRSATFRFDKRHVLYAKLRPYLNKVATPGFEGRCSTELVPLLPRDGVEREFVAQLLRRRETVEYAIASVTGSRMPRTDMNALMLLPVLCPPLNYQTRFRDIMQTAQVVASRADTARQTISKLNNSLMSRLLEGMA